MRFDHDRRRWQRTHASFLSGGALKVPYSAAGKVALRAKLLRLKREAAQRRAP